MNSHIQSQVIFDKKVKNTHEEKIVFSENGIEKTGYPHKKNELEPNPTPITKNNLKWIKTNIKPEAVVLLENNIRRNFLDTWQYVLAISC